MLAYYRPVHNAGENSRMVTKARSLVPNNACERLKAEAEDLHDRERVRLEKFEARRIRLEDLAAEEATLEAEAACQREFEASNRQRATEATSRQTGIEQEAELAAEEARVNALRTAIQGRRGGTVPPSVTPSPFGNANLIQDGTLTTLPFQPSRTQAMNPLFSDLAEPLFKAISENTLAFVNVLNLSTDYTPDREKLKVLKVNSGYFGRRRTALLSEVKGSLYLIQCFLHILHLPPSATTLPLGCPSS